MGDLSINLGDSLPYLENRFRELIGKDEQTLEVKAWFSNLQSTALKNASLVHCVGMHRPLPFQEIYQPARIRVRRNPQGGKGGESYAYTTKSSRSLARAQQAAEHVITMDRLLRNTEDSVIFAGPGWGKTTFLHFIFQHFVGDANTLPVLITLRRPTAVGDLERFVSLASRLQKKARKAKVLLLVDGYDELSIGDRVRVSDALLNFQGLNIGHLYLTCREYYQVVNLKLSEIRLDGFNTEDKYKFVRAFLLAFESDLNATEVVDELENRGFREFSSHPLLLALACIARTGSPGIQPRSAIRLLERALDVLCYLWDDYKGIERARLTPLDGKDRIKILKRIAFAAKSPHLSMARAEGMTRQQLALMTFDKVDPHKMLVETAQFYGILVPSDDGYEFVHRTIHDFLAAQYWVETGQFANETSYEWNSRTAYAACRLDDCSRILVSALSSDEGIPIFTEILSNSPDFNMKVVGAAIVNYFSVPGRAGVGASEYSRGITGMLNHDFITLLNTRFLEYMVEYCPAVRTDARDLIAGYCIYEVKRRNLKLDFTTFQQALQAFRSERFTFDLWGLGTVTLGDVKPEHTSR